MARTPILPAFALMAVLLSCSNRHLIEERSYRNAVLDDFHARYDKYGGTRNDLFSFADAVDDVPTREAMQFLLTYMPLNDLAGYNPEFLLANVDAALKTRKEMKWGAAVPYELFLHFVLPQRVNNENIDSFRLVYHDELKQRIKGLEAEQAALEINHWCHEKVSYQPSDIRTSAPMATILSARGRCGEESTLTVTALRAIGLPARQVYTPRWAHSDDNHAWVEVWIDGTWYYMGACEPEPVLDRGWFTEPARRAMLTHTKAFGRYNGDEPLVKREDLYSEINALGKYADTRELKITVIADNGEPVPGACVDYLLYNYAELYPIASLKCDQNGNSTFTTGKGNIVVWASKGREYGFKNVSLLDTDSVVVSISEEHPMSRQQLDLTAPTAGQPLPGPSEDLTRANAARLKEEDSIRQTYIDTWMKNISIEDVSAKTGLDTDRLIKVLKTSMGNYQSILSFLYSTGNMSDLALRLLESISEKDLRDTPADVLIDHISEAPDNNAGYDPGFYDAYILSPRVDNEILTPFRSTLRSVLPPVLVKQFTSDPSVIVTWIDSAVTISETENYYGTPIAPIGVEKLRTSDAHSRDIFFVALCRTLGHPARLEPATGKPQYFKEGNWKDIWFSGAEKPSAEKSFVTFATNETNPAPEYHIHFSLARFDQGKYKTLEFGENVKVNDMQSDIPVDPGRYMLVTGNRDENGNVLAELDFFELQPGDSITIAIKLRHKEDNRSIRGKVCTKNELTSFEGSKISIPSLLKKGLIAIWIEPGKEPTRHILNDIPLLKKEFDEWGGCFLFLLDPDATTESFRPAEISGLPENTLFAWDKDYSFLNLSLPSDFSEVLFPIVLSADNLGNILFTSEGYRIGIGEQILKSIK